MTIEAIVVGYQIGIIRRDGVHAVFIMDDICQWSVVITDVKASKRIKIADSGGNGLTDSIYCQLADEIF